VKEVHTSSARGRACGVGALRVISALACTAHPETQREHPTQQLLRALLRGRPRGCKKEYSIGSVAGKETRNDTAAGAEKRADVHRALL